MKASRCLNTDDTKYGERIHRKYLTTASKIIMIARMRLLR